MFYTKINLFFTLILLTSFGACKNITEDEVAFAIHQNAVKYNIDPKIIYTLIFIESGFNPNAIGVVTSYEKAQKLKALSAENIVVKIGTTYHSKISLVSIYPKDFQTASFIANQLEIFGFTFDAGLMQVNTVNFSLEESMRIMEPQKNIEKGTKHLALCFKQFSSMRYVIECYNRGGGNLSKMLRGKKRYFPFWERFKKHYNISFSPPIFEE